MEEFLKKAKYMLEQGAIIDVDDDIEINDLYDLVTITVVWLAMSGVFEGSEEIEDGKDTIYKFIDTDYKENKVKVYSINGFDTYLEVNDARIIFRKKLNIVECQSFNKELMELHRLIMYLADLYYDCYKEYKEELEVSTQN